MWIDATKLTPVRIELNPRVKAPSVAATTDPCARLLDHLSGRGVPYTLHAGDLLSVTIGNVPAAGTDNETLDAAITAGGYDLAPQTPPAGNLVIIFLAVVALSFLSGMTYGPVAALLSDMFPPAVRYSSMSIPYHIGTGYFGGFLPFIASYMVAKTGNPYAGLWYTLAVVGLALLVILWGDGKRWTIELDAGNAGH